MTRDYGPHLLLTEQEIKNLFDSLRDDDPQAASDFFVRFELAPLYHANKFYECLDTGHLILHLLAKLNQEKYRIIHKGYLLYWMSMAAYRIHDYQTAVYYMDATLSEDLRNFPESTDTPPHLFLRLEGHDPRQAAQAITATVEATIQEYMAVYNQIAPLNGQRPISIESLRNGFLRPLTLASDVHKRSLTSTFISFFAEFKYRDFQLGILSGPRSNEPVMLHLFKGCLLFESLLKNNSKNRTDGTLERVLVNLREDLNLGKPNLSISAKSLDIVLKEAVDANNDLLTSIILTGKLRNTLSHNLGWDTEITNLQYQHCFLHISIALFHSLNLLYPG